MSDKPRIDIDGIMRAADAVEFMSDQQTDKGPSGGTILKIEGKVATIRHSDHRGQEFYIPNLQVKRETVHHDGKRKLWQFA